MYWTWENKVIQIDIDSKPTVYNSSIFTDLHHKPKTWSSENKGISFIWAVVEVWAGEIQSPP